MTRTQAVIGASKCQRLYEKKQRMKDMLITGRVILRERPITITRISEKTTHVTIHAKK